MEKDTGVLTVKRSLKSNIFSPEFYSFEVDVYDEGLPQRSATASIYIDVRKDLSLDYGIGFDSRFYRWQVSENGSVSRGQLANSPVAFSGINIRWKNNNYTSFETSVLGLILFPLSYYMVSWSKSVESAVWRSFFRQNLQQIGIDNSIVVESDK